ncbi:MAG: hypothetical protein ACHQ01_01675 [Candidatus Limnocylindrales bacterium]
MRTTATGEDFGIWPTRSTRSPRGSLAQISALDLLSVAGTYAPLRQALLKRLQRQEGQSTSAGATRLAAGAQLQPEAPARRDPLAPFRSVARAIYQGDAVRRPLYLHEDGTSEVRDYTNWGFSEDEMRYAAYLILGGHDLMADEATFAELAMREALSALAGAAAIEQERQDMDREWRELREAERTPEW